MPAYDELVDDYERSLNELTFNSRPIIGALTTIAMENTQAADGIINAISSRIRRSIPDQKLFAFYLLDSICKNVGDPYNVLVSDDLYKLFSEAYVLVNEATRKKFHNLFKTWKVAKTSLGLPLFPRSQLDSIETFLSRATKSNGPQSQQEQLTNNVILKDIDDLFPIFNSKLESYPNDTELRDRYSALQQLRSIVANTPLPPYQLKAIREDVGNIRKREAEKTKSSMKSPTAGPTHHTQSVSFAAPVQSQPQQTYTPTPQPLSQIDVASLKGLLSVTQKSQPNNLVANVNNLSITGKPALGPNLFQSLVSSGLVKKSASKSTAPLIPLPSSNILGSLLLPSQKKSGDGSKYGDEVELRLTKITLTQAFINSSPQDDLVRLLFEAKETKCPTCGKRFSNDNQGTVKRRLHADWHFRINKKIQNEKIIQSRNWYLDDLDWVKFRDSEILEYDVESTAQLASNGDDKSSLESKYVIIPDESSDMTAVCGICRDTLRGVFSDELGEWVWNNAISVKQGSNVRIFHNTCYNETMNSSAAQLPISGVKRERTPEDDLQKNGAGNGTSLLNNLDLSVLKGLEEAGPKVKREKIES